MGHEHDGKKRSDIITFHEQDGKHVLCTVLALMFLSWSFGLTDRRVRLAYNIKRNMIVFARLLLRWSSEFAKTSRLDSSDMSIDVYTDAHNILYINTQKVQKAHNILNVKRNTKAHYTLYINTQAVHKGTLYILYNPGLYLAADANGRQLRLHLAQPCLLSLGCGRQLQIVTLRRVPCVQRLVQLLPEQICRQKVAGLRSPS